MSAALAMLNGAATRSAETTIRVIALNFMIAPDL